MTSHPSNDDIPELKIPEELKELDIRVCSPGTIRVSYSGLDAKGDEEREITRKSIPGTRPREYSYPLDEEITCTTWRHHKINLLALVERALGEAGGTSSGQQLRVMKEALEKVTDKQALEDLRIHWKSTAKELLSPSYKLSSCKHAGIVTWLHLSDLHCKAPDCCEAEEVYERAVVLKALWDDIGERCQRISPDLKDLDFACITGDLAYYGVEKEYQFIKTEILPKILEAAGLDGSRLFVVPGNHDIFQKKVPDAAKAGRELLLRDSGESTLIIKALTNIGERAIYFRRLEAYRDFFRQVFGKVKTNEEGFFYVQPISLPSGITIAILGLNSAWLSYGGESDRGKLVIGQYQVDKAILEAKKPYCPRPVYLTVIKPVSAE